ncbi:MAG: hypothetical protein WD401_00795 [Thermomicrobiaceae bacterium]
MSNPFSWDYLTAPVEETAVWGPFSIAFLIIFATGLFVAIFFSYDAPRRLQGRHLLLRTIRRGTWIAIPVFSLGLLFFVFRVLQISALGLHMRLWLYLCLLLAIAIIIYFWYYIRTIYPRHAAAEEAEARKNQYLKRPAHGGGGGSGRSRRKKGSKKKSS